MAFIGLFVAIIATIIIMLIASIVPYILGTFLFKKTKYKKTGIALRIISYITFIPVLALSVIVFAIMK